MKKEEGFFLIKNVDICAAFVSQVCVCVVVVLV